MSRFGAWAAGPGGTAGLLACMLALGLILGYLTGARGRRPEQAFPRPGRTISRRQNRDSEAIDREADRAAAQFRAMRLELHHEPDPERQQRREAMARRTHPVFRELPPAPVALVRDDLTDSAYTADMAARTDRLIEYIESLARVPYSADELWSGQ